MNKIVTLAAVAALTTLAACSKEAAPTADATATAEATDAANEVANEVANEATEVKIDKQKNPNEQIP